MPAIECYVLAPSGSMKS